jgi:hypothetical protein
MGKQNASLGADPLRSVFHELVGTALNAQGVAASPHTEHYLESLLVAFARSDPQRFSRALGVSLLEASALEPMLRYARFKEVADTSLFLSGIFLDYVEAQMPATEYFFEIGSAAYLRLGALDERHDPTGRGLAQTYTDLGRRFEDFVRVLTAISDRELFSSHRRTLRLYERWLAGGGKRDERRLLAMGVFPSRPDTAKPN